MPWYNFILTPKAQSFILGVIIVNAITLGLETSSTFVAATGNLLTILDQIALGIFVVELSLKMLALRSKFVRDPWNIFDFIIVAIAFIPNAGPFTVLRSLRILRALRLISTLPKLRVIVLSLLRSLPSLGWISLLLLVVFYIFAVIATRLFGAAFPEWFGSLGATFFTLFQVLTLESWAMGIARPVMEAFPYAYLFFVPFVLMTSFVVLNVFIAIIVNAMSDIRDEENAQKKEEMREDPARELEHQIVLVREQLDKLENMAKSMQK